jgi:hypothetical protein
MDEISGKVIMVWMEVDLLFLSRLNTAIAYRPFFCRQSSIPGVKKLSKTLAANSSSGPCFNHVAEPLRDVTAITCKMIIVVHFAPRPLKLSFTFCSTAHTPWRSGSGP